MPLLEFKNVSKTFKAAEAVKGVSFSIGDGETLGLVGESGCGKTTVARMALRILRPNGGEILFEGQDLWRADRRALKKIRRDLQVVFQDPFSSLNPRMTVGSIVSEPLVVNGLCKANEGLRRAGELLEAVGLDGGHIRRYPHEFSGGQRQRICIARAISTKPKLIVADEPVSSLDVLVQADILDLLMGLRKDFGISYLFISHDLRIVSKMCDRICVMYAGNIVEELKASEIKQARHPYTQKLISAVPVADRGLKKK